MKISVELSDSELKEICYMTGEIKKGPAIRKLVVDALMLKRRQDMAAAFISGKIGLELKGFEAGRAIDRKTARKRSSKWRG
jgi:hypothetical protein